MINYKYYPSTIKEQQNGVILESDNENAICSSMIELYLQKKVVDIPKLKKFINSYGDDDHKWLIDPRKYNYSKFKVIWLKKCSNSLRQELAKDEIVREAVSKIIRDTYLKDGLEDDMLDIYFNYFTNG